MAGSGASDAQRAKPAVNPPDGRVFALEGDAQTLANRLPDLMMEVTRVTSTVSHGIHGRRRAGPGETFWQFRQYQSSDAAQTIDWRRSASSDHLYVREREWEAAHTVWMWSDLSASMNFRSHLAPATKRDRGLVLMLALSELLVRGGERVALLGLLPPMASRKASNRMAEALAAHGAEPLYAQSLPPDGRLSRFSGAVFISDFLDPIEPMAERIVSMAQEGVSGHLVQVLDPAEETLPYDGRAEFLGMEGDERWVADRVETLRPQYQARLASHRAELAALARRLGWTLLVHHTDRPATEPLLSLILRLQGTSGDYRWSTGDAAPSTATSPQVTSLEDR